MEWQPIETAPKDGRNILVYTKNGTENGIVSVEWVVWPSGREDWEPVGVWPTYDDSANEMGVPILWMPAPNPPETIDNSTK